MPLKRTYESVDILRTRAEKTRHPKTLKKLFLALYREKEYEECILWAQQYINRDEKDSTSLMTCAECYYALRKYKVSLEYSARAQALQIESQNIVLNYTPSPEQERMITLIRRVLMIDVLSSRFNCFVALGKPDKAYELALEIIELGSYDPVFWFALFEHHKRAGTLWALDRVIDSQLAEDFGKNSVIIHTIKGLIHTEQAEFDKALCEFAHTDPNNAELNGSIACFRADVIRRMNTEE